MNGAENQLDEDSFSHSVDMKAIRLGWLRSFVPRYKRLWISGNKLGGLAQGHVPSQSEQTMESTNLQFGWLLSRYLKQIFKVVDVNRSDDLEEVWIVAHGLQIF